MWREKRNSKKILKVWKTTRCGHWADVCAWDMRVFCEINIYRKITPNDRVMAEGMRWAATKKRAVPILELLLEMVTERRLSGRCEGVLGGESRLKALAIIRVAAETEKTIPYSATIVFSRIVDKFRSKTSSEFYTEKLIKQMRQTYYIWSFIY